MAKKPPTFSAVKRGYTNLWGKAELRPAKTSAAQKAADTIYANRARYEKVAERIGHPEVWPLIGALHWREASGSFAGVLHNGEPIIGTGRTTRLVPAGRGPFASWEEAAVDALVIKGWHRIADWNLIARWLFMAEAFNGWGYFMYRDVNSPYLWAATSLQQAGKYVADGKWSSTAMDQQLGVVSILKALFAKHPELEPKGQTTPQATPEIITATTAGAGAVVATIQDEMGLALGLSVAFVFLLAAWVQQGLLARASASARALRAQQNKGTLFMNYISANSKTTALGVAGVLGSLGTLITMLANKNYDPNALMGVAGTIATSIGLIFAKDGNVTGGSKPNAGI